MIYPNLRAELARKNMSVQKLSAETGIPFSTLNARLDENGRLLWADAKAIKKALSVNIPLEKLFEEE